MCARTHTPARSQGEESRPGEHPGKSSWLSCSAKLVRNFLSTSKFAKQKASTSVADPALSGRLETWLPPLLAITSFCCIANLFNLAQNFRNICLYPISRILSKQNKRDSSWVNHGKLGQKKSTVRPRHQINRPKRYLDTSIICNSIHFTRTTLFQII